MLVNEDYAGMGGDIDMKMSVSQLRFQVLSLQSQLALAEHEKTSSAATLTRFVAEKAAQCDRLKASFDSLHADHQSDLSKHKNELDMLRLKAESTAAKLGTAELESARLESDNAILHRKVMEYSKETRSAREELATHLEMESNAAAEVEKLKQVNKDLASENDRLASRLEEYAQQLSESSQQNSIEHFQKKIESLTSKNSTLQAQVERLQQHNVSIGVLSEKNDLLSRKLSRSQQALQEAHLREADLLQSVASNRDIVSALKSIVPESITASNKPKAFLSAIEEIRCQNAVLAAECKALKQAEANANETLASWRDTIAPQLETDLSQCKHQLSMKEEAMAVMERQLLLNAQEINFLRHLLESDLRSENGNAKPSEKFEALDELATEYRAEVAKLKQKSSNSSEATPRKRAKHNVPAPSNGDASDFINLRTKVSHLQSLLHIAEEQLETFRKVDQKKSELKVLQYSNNPQASDQQVKRATLDALRKENEDLIARFVTSTDENESGQLIPRLVFVRQEDDKARLQAQIDAVTRRITRLKSAYTEKSKDILTIISRYFGYAVEFLPNPINPDVMSSRLKLVSRYMPANSNCYLTIDLTTTAMKAYGDYDFKSLYEELLSSFTKDQVPCFLSALNLKVYDLYGEKS